MDAAEYNLIKREVMSLTGIDLNFYKDTQMQRRLNSYLLRVGQPSWRDYFKVVRQNNDELQKLRDYLTINVSSFYRDTEKYVHLQERVLPELLHHNPKLRIWSAGCSRGQEPYTLALMLLELTGSFRRHYILASDLDRGALTFAKNGGPYTKDDIAGVSPILLKKYFKQENDSYWVADELKQRITFKQHNLLADRFENNFDLIICRNVVIYFTAPVKDKLYLNFYQALRPGGILFVGGTEIVPKAQEIGFDTAGISFYRRRNGIK